MGALRVHLRHEVQRRIDRVLNQAERIALGAASGARAVVVVTAHTDVVEEINKADLAQTGVEVIIDGRNALDAEHIVSQGIIYSGIGRRA